VSTLGQKPATQHVSLQKQTITGNGGTSYSLQQSVGSALDIAVFVNNTRQEPTGAYSASGTTLTMTGAVNSSDHFYVIFLGKAITTTGLPVDAVATANINASAITNAKIANSTIDLTSKVTGVLPTASGGTGDTAGSGMVKLFEGTIGNVAAYDLSSTYINSSYDSYVVHGYFLPDGDNKYLYMQVFVGGTIQDGSIYGNEGQYMGSGSYFGGNTETAWGFQQNGSGNDAGEGTTAHITVSNVNSTVAPCSMSGITNYAETGGAHQGSITAGSLIVANRANVVNGFRFKFHSGDIASGFLTLYGMK